MGTIVRAACGQCGYQKKLFLGGGLRDCNPEAALAAAPEDQDLAKALREGARFQIDRDAAVCWRCHQLFATPYVTYWPSEGESRHTAAACPICGGILTRLSREATNTMCPSCGNKATLTPCGHWD